jgi:hypothetical protein
MERLDSKGNEAMAQGQRRKIEIFTAGCSTCNETVDLVKRIAGSNHDIEIHDMHQPQHRNEGKAARGAKPAGCGRRRQARGLLRWART